MKYIARPILSACLPAAIFVAFTTVSHGQSYTWNGTVNDQWFTDANWTNTAPGTQPVRVIGAGASVVIRNGAVNGDDLRLSGVLTVDGAAQPTSYLGNLTSQSGQITIANGATWTRRSDDGYTEVEGDTVMTVTGVAADGRRSSWTSNFIQTGYLTGGSQQIRVDDGGIIAAGKLYLSDGTSSVDSTSTVVVSGRNANGTASTLNAGIILAGQVEGGRGVGHLLIEGGAIANVGSIRMGRDSTLAVTGIPGGYETRLNVDMGIDLLDRARMTIRGGAAVTADYVKGQLTVSGGDGLNSSSLFLTGQEGLDTDSLLVEGGGFVSTAYLMAGESGVASITGTDTARGTVETGRLIGKKGGEIVVDGGEILFTRGGDVDGGSEVSIRIAEKGLWLDTPLDVLLDGDKALTGEGGLWKGRAGSLELTGANTYSGGTVVRDGVLIVNNTGGSATGSGRVHVRSGAVLTGGGIIGGDVRNAGTLAPGNSPGKLRIRGNFMQVEGGTLEIEAGPSGQDLLQVDGRVRLDGHLLIDNDGVLQYGDGLTFLTSGFTISGEFDSITFTHAQEGRTRLMTRDGQVSLVIAPHSYTDVAETANEQRIAAALDTWIDDSGGDTSEVVLALDHLNAAGYRNAFVTLSPALFSTAVDTALEQSHAQSHMLAGQLHSRALHGLPKDGKDWHAWAISGGMYSSGSMSSLKGDDYSSGAFLTGIGRQIAPGAEAGLFLGSGESEGNFQGATRTEQERLSIGGYALASHGGFHGSGALSVGTLDLETRRDIGFGPLSRIARSDTDGIEFSAMVSGGYDFHRGAWSFGPVASLQYSKVRYDDVDEYGSGALDLRVQDPEDDSLRSRVGVRVSYVHPVNQGLALIPQGGLFWQHEYLRGRGNLDAAFQQGAGPSFTHSPSDADADSIVGSLGLGFQTKLGLYGNISYDVEAGRESELNHTISVGVDWRF